MQHRPEVSMTSGASSGETFTASPRRASYVSAMLVPVGAFGSAQDVGLSPPAGPDDISLHFDNVPPGRYRVLVMVNAGYVSSAVSGSTDLVHNPLVVDGGSVPQPIEITVRDDGAEVRGHVDGLTEVALQGSAGNRGTRASSFIYPSNVVHRWGSRQPVVYFIPEPRGSSGQFTRIFIQPGGEFRWSQMAPGSYRALAFEHQQDGLEFATEEQLRDYDGTAQRIELAAGDKQALKLAITSLED